MSTKREISAKSSKKNSPLAPVSDLYRRNLSLLTDLYQLTMGYGYWKDGIADRPAVFNLYFRKHPFEGGYTVACGLTWVVDYLRNLKFAARDIAYLRNLQDSKGEPLFEEDFLTYLADLMFTCDVDAVPDGTIVHPNEPLVRVKGPLLQCQLIETALLCIMNFQTLIATKAARIKQAAGGRPVLEFGLRRAQGIDGSLSGSWAAHVGGCDATSNVLAGEMFGIPVKGTHAHSWVMSYELELEAFLAYAQAMPSNCVFLVDTYDTISGVANAIHVGQALREHGYEMCGIRLDSGDIAELSIKARRMLDEAGFQNALIVASDDLDEYKVERLFDRGAMISVLGIGTNLITGGTQSALGGVYKLAAIQDHDGSWEYKVKVSDEETKISNPGIQQVRRYYEKDTAVGDVIYDATSDVTGFVSSVDGDTVIDYPRSMKHEDLLVPVFRNGALVYGQPTLEQIRARVQQGLESLPAQLRRTSVIERYPVGLEQSLHARKRDIVEAHQNHNGTRYDASESSVQDLIWKLEKAAFSNSLRKPEKANA